MEQIQSGPLLFADTLLKNLCNMKTIMWLVVCEIYFGALMGQIQSGSLLFADTLLKNLCNMKTIMWMNSASWFVRFILER